MNVRRLVRHSGLFFGILWAISCAQSPPEPFTLRAADMHPQGPHTVTPIGAVTFWGKGTLNAKAYLEKGPVTIVVRALGHTVGGRGPVLSIALGGQVIGQFEVDSDVVKTFAIKSSTPSAGTVLLRLSFENHLAVPPDGLSGRWLQVEQVSVNPG